MLQRAASAAMVAAKELIAAAVEELSRRADAAARARAAADAHDAAVIAACVAKTASAFTLLNEAATMRMEWEASRPAESKAAWISPGHEETAAAMDARVRRGLQERAAADRRTANRASHDAAAAAENVAEAVERAATANTMVSYAQGLALGRIAFAVGTQVAVNEMERAAAAV